MSHVFEIRNVELKNEHRPCAGGAITLLAKATLLVHESTLGRHFRVNTVLADCVPKVGSWFVVKVALKRFSGENQEPRIWMDFPEIRMHGAVEYVPIAHTTTAAAREQLTAYFKQVVNAEVKKLTVA